jgi:hypothetical protein
MTESIDDQIETFEQELSAWRSMDVFYLGSFDIFYRAFFDPEYLINHHE